MSAGCIKIILNIVNKHQQTINFPFILLKKKNVHKQKNTQ